MLAHQQSLLMATASKSTGISLYYEMIDDSLKSFKGERNGNEYLINLIDSPGHIDFSYEAQLKDTAEAVQAAGELPFRLKEAEEPAINAQKRIMVVEQKATKAHKQIDKLKKKHEKEIGSPKQVCCRSAFAAEGINISGAFFYKQHRSYADTASCYQFGPPHRSVGSKCAYEQRICLQED
ncbi:hypothetical protein KIW84_074788 [Lathyrus oleraceus]|uniref:Uncharacterized protein n=1 Tax=Pisum sativum TaxID=3888 RepID=A0A9D4VV21_PEA|nr:hypothetical protein KIW84_074788 [Pisum sativum]